MESAPTLYPGTNPARRVLVAGATWFLVYLASRFAWRWRSPPRWSC